MVDGSGAKLSVELFGAEASQVLDVVRPEVKNVVAAEPVALLDHDDLGPEELSFNGSAETARTWNIKFFTRLFQQVRAWKLFKLFVF